LGALLEIVLDPHASGRARQRGATEVEIRATVAWGERFAAKRGRTGFRRNFNGPFIHEGRRFDTKQLEVYAVLEDDVWIVITVIVKWF
jgi:hypothetical protein